MKTHFHRWHSMLAMPKHDEDWHRKDMRDELDEYCDAHGIIEKWSELSDVVYTCTRARWSGHTNILFPFSGTLFYIGAIYMIPKYTLRWRFFRVLGKKCDPNSSISEVRNPKKLHKLEEIAERNGLDPDIFKKEAKKLMRHRLFLK